MLAAIFETVGKPLVVERVDDPRPEPGELIVRVEACGVCGSDIHAATHSAFGRSLPTGTILGHEFTGEVVDLSADAAGRWRRGDRVAGFPIFGCGACGYCLQGRPASCRAARFAGLQGAQGAYAEFVRVPAAHSVPIANHVSMQTAALIEPLAVCLHAVRSAMPIRHASVLIIGAGPIGLILAAVCRHLGARDVVVSDIVAERAERSRLVGAEAIDAGRQDVRAAFRAVAGRRPTVVFDAAGGRKGLSRAMDLAGENAQVVVVAVHEGEAPVPGMIGFYKELRLSFAKAYGAATFREAAGMIESGAIDLSPVVTDVVGFDGFPAMFDSLSRPSGRGKVLLQPSFQQPEIRNATHN
ncbi:zinc-dependent alcohol dehydrogenase [Rhizobium sp.]